MSEIYQLPFANGMAIQLPEDSFSIKEILSNTKLPVLTLIAAINGKVIGFPKKVPNIDAKTFALNK